MSMAEFEKKIRSVTDTPFGYTLSMIGGKWRLVLLYWLWRRSRSRFNELQRKIGTITYKALSRELKEMEADGFGPAQGISPGSSQGRIQPDGKGRFPLSIWSRCASGDGAFKGQIESLFSRQGKGWPARSLLSVGTGWMHIPFLFDFACIPMEGMV